MSYATLMVHLDVDGDCDKRVQLAVDLADRFHASLIGVSGWAPRPAFMVQGIVVDAALAEREYHAMTARLEETRKRFHLAAKNIEHVEWRGAVGFPIEILVREARAADLIVIGGGRAPGSPHSAIDSGATILRVGRPVLIVPADVGSLAARRVLVAWSDTREARRAVRDALPFLKAAEEVLIANVCEDAEVTEGERAINDLTNYLLRHKVVVGAKICLQTKGAASEELLRFAREAGADLLVAGAYGHSRFGEWIFGGVTRELLSASPICCLMSH